MALKESTTLILIISCVVQNSALLVQGDGSQIQTNSMDLLGTDGTLSLLVQEVLSLKAKVKTQKQKVQVLRSYHTYDNNVTALQSIERRMENVTQSLRYLTLSQQVHDLEDKGINRTINQELKEINTKLNDLEMKDHLLSQNVGKTLTFV